MITKISDYLKIKINEDKKGTFTGRKIKVPDFKEEVLIGKISGYNGNGEPTYDLHEIIGVGGKQGEKVGELGNKFIKQYFKTNESTNTKSWARNIALNTRKSVAGTETRYSQLLDFCKENNISVSSLDKVYQELKYQDFTKSREVEVILNRLMDYSKSNESKLSSQDIKAIIKPTIKKLSVEISNRINEESAKLMKTNKDLPDYTWQFILEGLIQDLETKV